MVGAVLGRFSCRNLVSPLRLEDFAAAPSGLGSDVSPAASEVSDRLWSRAGSASATSDRAGPLTGAVSGTGGSAASNCRC